MKIDRWTIKEIKLLPKTIDETKPLIFANQIEEFIKKEIVKCEESFKKLFENNSKRDWNNPIFRKTITSAFIFALRKHFKLETGDKK
jgi:hypothetical protein